MIPITDHQLQDFQEALDWKTGLTLPDGRVLGVAGKRGKTCDGLDSRVRLIAERLEPADKTILEVGFCEGVHTVQLAQICKNVVALEVRPRNVACALVRLFVHGVENAKLVLKDVRDLDDRFGRFDILFHVGVLYHLMNPVEHLFKIRNLAGDLLLDTHYSNDDTRFERSDIWHAGKSYRAFLYRGEGGWSDAFSGLEAASAWLHREALLELLHDVGFESVEVVRDRIERNGPRICLLARRQARGQHARAA